MSELADGGAGAELPGAQLPGAQLPGAQPAPAAPLTTGTEPPSWSSSWPLPPPLTEITDLQFAEAMADEIDMWVRDATAKGVLSG